MDHVSVTGPEATPPESLDTATVTGSFASTDCVMVFHVAGLRVTWAGLAPPK